MAWTENPISRRVPALCHRHWVAAGLLGGFGFIAGPLPSTLGSMAGGSGPWSESWSSVVGGGAPQEKPDDRRHLPTRFLVQERAGIARKDGLVQVGVPLARGEVRGVRPDLKVTLQGKAVPASFSPLAWWPDGSLRWVRLAMPIVLAARGKKEFLLEKGKGLAFAAKPPRLPRMKVMLVTDKGTSTFPLRKSGTVTRGEHRLELDVEPVTDSRLRLRVHVAQLDRDAVWKALTVELASSGAVKSARKLGAIAGGEWTAVIRHAVERGPKDVRARKGKLLLHLYPPSAPPYAADKGFHVRHEIILERSASPGDLARRVASPLRAALDPAYVHATRAMGRTGIPDAKSRPLDRAFQESYELLDKQRALPRNRGWMAWGDFFDRDNGSAYAGYLNQEYDPATALFIRHARTGDADVLDAALQMARQYADNVSLRGGCYHHRSTVYAMQGTIAKALGEAIRKKWRKRPRKPVSDAEALAYVRENYGKGAVRAVIKIQASMSARTREAREKSLSEQLGYSLVHDSLNAAKKDGAFLARLKRRYGARIEKLPLLREMAVYHLSSPSIKHFGLPKADILFRPFFGRYGGSWDDFPAFHFYDLPAEKHSHGGGHSLAGMLVWGHLWSGNPALRRAALDVARHHVDVLVAQSIEHVNGEISGGRLTFARIVGWPLVNLLDLEVLTEKAEPALDAKVKRAMRDLITCILAIDPERYQSTIHVGIVSEGLARYHERTADPKVRKYLIRLMRYWTSTQWNKRRRTLNYIKDQPNAGWPELSAFCIYGIEYAAWQSGDRKLHGLAREIVKRMCEERPDYAKSFGMQFHNSQRATGIPWPGRRASDKDPAGDGRTRR